MTIKLPDLWKHRPFQIAWVWETLCIAGSVFLFLKTESTPLMMGVILIGVAPMVVVVMRHSMARAAGATTQPDRSKDIVQ
ncbi:MAG: hypothetical protein HY859_03190 [Caulobacterales bacterium]|nr:hypothetical protein [Caulobacterales bacterium]